MPGTGSHQSLIIVIISVSPAAIREAARVGAERKEA